MKGIRSVLDNNFKSSGSGLPDINSGYGNAVENVSSMGIRPVRCQTIRVNANASDRDSSINLGRNFKAPKKSDNSQWAKVKFLVDHGFVFQKIRVNSNQSETVPYPETLSEAKEFVEKYKKYAIKPKIT